MVFGDNIQRNWFFDETESFFLRFFGYPLKLLTRADFPETDETDVPDGPVNKDFYKDPLAP